MTRANSRLSAQARAAELHFTISEVAKLLGLSASTLRLWEKLGLSTPVRSAAGYRMYSQSEVERLKRVQWLRVEHGLNANGVRHVIEGRGASPKQAGRKSTSTSISRQLRKLRLSRDMTLAEAAGKAELSVSFLSGLERDQTNASIATLRKLSEVYDTNVLSFFGKADAAKKLVRKRDRKRLQSEPGVAMELLAMGKTAMEPHLFYIAPGVTSGGAYQHEGEEFVYVLRGECEFWLDEVEHYRLRPGDCLYFSSHQAHRWSNSGTAECVLFWVNTPPTF